MAKISFINWIKFLNTKALRLLPKGCGFNRTLLVLIMVAFVIVHCLSCYEPKEGCLNIDAVNYDVTADDLCGDCCSFPELSLSVRHEIRLPGDTVAFQYGVPYPSVQEEKGSFVVDRARYFLSNFRLVLESGEIVGISDSLTIVFADGQSFRVENNFAKLDRDNFQTKNIGTILMEGTVNEVQFTFGLEEFLQQKEPTSGIPTSHPLDISSDTLIYEDGLGYIPNLLIIRRDTFPTTDSLTFQFFEPMQVSIPLDAPVFIERGFDVKLTMRVDYLDWFKGIDFNLDGYKTIEEKIETNLSNVFQVTELRME